jgi:uncharacterized DUF497 family protein
LKGCCRRCGRRRRRRGNQFGLLWQKFDPEQFEFEFDEDELAGHDVSTEEAMEVFLNRFDVQRNKRHHGGYQLVGRTDSGRRLKLIIKEKNRSVIRVITGWDI